jgi:hypothetical protein
MRKSLLALTLCGAMLGSPTAHAAGVDPATATSVQREQANARFLKGKALFDRNDFAGALDHFRASVDIVASPNARLYIARTLREMGRLVDAYAEFARTAAEAKEHAREDGRYGKAAEAALAERESIAPQLGFVLLNIKNASAATAVTVAGSPLLRAGWAEPVPVMPGDVQVEAVTPGIVPIRKTLIVRAGQRASLDIDAGVPDASSVAAPPPGGVDQGHPSVHTGKEWMLPAAIAGGGVALAGGLMFLIGGVASNGTYSDLEMKCGTSACPPSQAGEISSGKTEQAVANAGAIIGLVGLAAGGTFLVLWLLPSHKTTASASVSFGPGTLSLSGKF